jgi:hypothetical protein
MSVLETPRILFRGNIAWDPITTNNRQVFYNENDCESVLAPGETVQTYRNSAIAAVPTGLWDPDGTHRTIFYDTEISGTDLGAGVVTDDPFVGSPVGFLGMLVDCEPYGTFSSQQFFDSIQFGILGGCRIFGPRNSRVIARYVNFTRNSANQMIAGVASVVWQTSFAKSAGLIVDAFDSPALQALAAALEEPDVLGLTVRWNTYRTIYYDNSCLRNGSADAKAAAADLAAKLQVGGFQPNPARGLMVGLIGLWRDGEPAQEPGDRALLTMPPAELVASAFARLADNQLTIDLSNSISEVDDLCNKQDLGPLTAVVVEPDGQTVIATLGSFDYDLYNRNAYERASGIVTIAVDPEAAEAAANADIQIRGGDGTVYLTETALRALPTDHNLYLNEGDSAVTTVQVYDRGVPAGAGVNVAMFDDGTQTLYGSQTTAADGTVQFTMNGIAGGAVEPYVLVAGPTPAADPGLDPQLTPYMYVRTLPADAAIGALAPTWANVYANVLQNWNAMAPCMDNWLRLNDEAQVRAFAPMLRQLTDPANFELYRFMPVTRDMTVGERTLLYNFLDSPASPTALMGAAAPPPKPPLRNLEKLSRAMRSN